MLKVRYRDLVADGHYREVWPDFEEHLEPPGATHPEFTTLHRPRDEGVDVSGLLDL